MGHGNIAQDKLLLIRIGDAASRREAFGEGLGGALFQFPMRLALATASRATCLTVRILNIPGHTKPRVQEACLDLHLDNSLQSAAAPVFILHGVGRGNRFC